MRKLVHKTAALLLSLLLLTQGGVSAFSHPFSDVPANAWYANAVQYAYTNCLFSGTSERRFSPNEDMTRAMIVTVLWRISGAPTGYSNTFSDVPHSAWYAQAVGWAASNRIIVGYNGQFAPSESITREEIAVILYAFSSTTEIPSPPSFASMEVFEDKNEISTWAQEAVCWAAENGIVTGAPSDTGLIFEPKNAATRAEVAQLLMRYQGQERSYFAQTLCYGISGSGKYPLTAYRLGSGKNVMVLTFALHGWEDLFDRDGQALVSMADHLFSVLCDNEALITDRDWTVYILRCVNPDGLYIGNSNNGPGRCTTHYYNEKNALIQKNGWGIDINRCFPYQFKAVSNARNYNGTAPLQCAEARALAAFTEQVRGSGYRVLIDTHGWYNQIITSSGKGALFRALQTQFPSAAAGYANLANGSGYYSAWAAYTLGYDSCLFELPPTVSSMNQFRQSNLTARFERVILQLLSDYHGAEAAQDVISPVCNSTSGN